MSGASRANTRRAASRAGPSSHSSRRASATPGLFLETSSCSQPNNRSYLRRQCHQHDAFLDCGKGEHATEMGQCKKNGAVEARPPPRVEVAARLPGLIDEIARLGVGGVGLDGRKAFNFLVGDIKTLERINSVARAPVALVEDRAPDQEIEPMHLGKHMLGTVSKGGARFGHQRIT